MNAARILQTTQYACHPERSALREVKDLCCTNQEIPHR
jgi:hypothetical protein